MTFSNDKPDADCKRIAGKSRLRLIRLFRPFGYVCDDTVIFKDMKIVFVNI